MAWGAVRLGDSRPIPLEELFELDELPTLDPPGLTALTPDRLEPDLTAEPDPELLLEETPDARPEEAEPLFVVTDPELLLEETPAPRPEEAEPLFTPPPS